VRLSGKFRLRGPRTLVLNVFDARRPFCPKKPLTLTNAPRLSDIRTYEPNCWRSLGADGDVPDAGRSPSFWRNVNANEERSTHAGRKMTIVRKKNAGVEPLWLGLPLVWPAKGTRSVQLPGCAIVRVDGHSQLKVLPLKWAAENRPCANGLSLQNAKGARRA